MSYDNAGRKPLPPKDYGLKMKERRLSRERETENTDVIRIIQEHERFRAALEEIANEDFRGNRPWSAVRAYKALKGDSE